MIHQEERRMKKVKMKKEEINRKRERRLENWTFKARL